MKTLDLLKHVSSGSVRVTWFCPSLTRSVLTLNFSGWASVPVVYPKLKKEKLGYYYSWKNCIFEYEWYSLLSQSMIISFNASLSVHCFFIKDHLNTRDVIRDPIPIIISNYIIILLSISGLSIFGFESVSSWTVFGSVEFTVCPVNFFFFFPFNSST